MYPLPAKIAVASFIPLFSLLFPVLAKQPAAGFARYMFKQMSAAAIDCPPEVIDEHSGRRVLCAGYAASFGTFKLDWEINQRRHDFPENVRPQSPWTLSGGGYRREYMVDSSPVTFIFDRSDSRLLAIYDPGDDIDTDGVEPEEPVRRSPREPGFGGVSLPELIPESKVEPLYPSEALERGLDGSVTLSVIIHEDGGVGEVTILAAEPEGIGFEEEAVRAVRRWRYEPSMYEGEAVEVRYTIYIPFVWTAH
jgi:TonB family protein